MEARLEGCSIIFMFTLTNKFFFAAKSVTRIIKVLTVEELFRKKFNIFFSKSDIRYT